MGTPVVEFVGRPKSRPRGVFGDVRRWDPSYPEIQQHRSRLIVQGPDRRVPKDPSGSVKNRQSVITRGLRNP
jgi:hypothetical protein